MMQIIQSKIFSLPLSCPVSVQGVTVLKRGGIQIQITDNNGIFGVGECVPLPGLHKESIEECESQLKRLSSPFQNKKRELTEDLLRLPLFGWMEAQEPLLPSVEFALEQAFLHFFSQSHPDRLKRLFHLKDDQISSKINGLIGVKEASIQELVKKIATDELSCLKIKIGRKPFTIEEDIQFVQELSKALHHRCQLRLDANRLIGPVELNQFWHATQGLPLEYFEEPLDGPVEDAKNFFSQTDIPIALDESVKTYLPLTLQLNFPKSIQALVIKPTTLGGIHQTIKIIDFCNSSQIKCVLSSAFDTGWTVATTILLAQLIKHPVPLGLDPYRLLKKDVLRKPLTLSRGKISLKTEDFTHDPKTVLHLEASLES